MKERKVVDYTKSCAGDRTVYVPQDARKLVKQIIKTNISNGIWEKGYLFIRDNGERIQSHSFSTALLRCCKNLNLTNRSMHKIRKTYISALIDGNIIIKRSENRLGTKTRGKHSEIIASTDIRRIKRKNRWKMHLN